jgi:serine/threonine-protein kinase
MDEIQENVVESKEPDLSGRQVGEFNLIRRLGQGAMAEVYLAEQVSLKRQVAIKILKKRLAADEVYVRRFQREAQAAAQLVHANIAQIHEVGEIGNVHYIAQEYVQGLNLRQWLARNGPPDLRLALVIMRQVAAALAKAAERGIVHRDIKPENIMLTRTGEVKVADFGLARLLGEGGAVDLTECGITLGTPLYMSPEQVEGRPLDPRSDIYSFGVTCYQMLAGSPPFSGETALSLALQHTKKQPDPLENHRQDLPPALCRVIHRMLAKTPEGRFQSALELLRELRRIQAENLGEDWPEDLPALNIPAADTLGPSIGEMTRRLDTLMKTMSRAKRRRPRWVLWGAAVLGAVLLGAAVGAVLPSEKPLLSASAASNVPRHKTVFGQWLYATQSGTPEAWQCVIDYFPSEGNYWKNGATQQLARIYLRHGDLDMALEKFEDLAALDETEVELKAFGLAGKAAVLCRKGRYKESADVINQLYPYRQKLNDRVMQGLVRRTMEKNSIERGAPNDKWQPLFDDWDKALKE